MTSFTRVRIFLLLRLQHKDFIKGVLSLVYILLEKHESYFEIFYTSSSYPFSFCPLSNFSLGRLPLSLSFVRF